MAIDLTVEEIIATLQRTSLTTVLVEGTDDMMIYRWIEDEIGIHNADFLPCKGRDNLIKIFNRRNEFPEAKVIFIADKDTYIYTNTPQDLEEIIWTNGYSIENDLYFGKNIEQILSNAEKEIFIKSLNNFLKYYCFEVERFINGDDDYTLRTHPLQVLCDINHTIKEEFLQTINFTEPTEITLNQITENYDVMLRGKTLFALLTRIVSKKGREVKHSKASLLEHCYRTHRSQKFIELLEKINQKISA